MTLGGWRRYAGDSGSLAAWLSLRSCLSVASNLDLGDAGRREVGWGAFVSYSGGNGGLRVRASVVAHLRLGAIFSSASRSSLSRLWKKLFRGDTIVPEDGPLLPDIVRRSGARPIVIEESVPWRGPRKRTGNFENLSGQPRPIGGHNAARRPRTSRRWLTTNTPVTRRSGHPRPACATRSAPRSSHPRPPTQPRTARATTARTRISARSMGTPR